MDEIVIYEKKRRRHPTQAQYHAVFQTLSNWFFREHITLWFWGHDGNKIRDGRTERLLNRFRKNNDLQAFWWGYRWIYCIKRVNSTRGDRTPDYVNHGVGCSEALVRFHISDRNSEILPNFRLPNIRPDGALKLSTGTTLLFEFCSYGNTLHRLKEKIKAYKESGGDYLVVFILDVDPKDVKKRAEGPFYFTDYDTFKNVNYGQQIDAKIYTYGIDGITYSLR